MRHAMWYAVVCVCVCVCVSVSMLTNNSPGKLLPTPRWWPLYAGRPGGERTNTAGRAFRETQQAREHGTPMCTGPPASLAQRPQQACYSKLTLDSAEPRRGRDIESVNKCRRRALAAANDCRRTGFLSSSSAAAGGGGAPMIADGRSGDRIALDCSVHAITAAGRPAGPVVVAAQRVARAAATAVSTVNISAIVVAHEVAIAYTSRATVVLAALAVKTTLIGATAALLRFA